MEGETVEDQPSGNEIHNEENHDEHSREVVLTNKNIGFSLSQLTNNITNSIVPPLPGLRVLHVCTCVFNYTLIIIFRKIPKNKYFKAKINKRMINA